jgi:hypothetical protein
MKYERRKMEKTVQKIYLFLFLKPIQGTSFMIRIAPKLMHNEFMIPDGNVIILPPKPPYANFPQMDAS